MEEKCPPNASAKSEATAAPTTLEMKARIELAMKELTTWVLACHSLSFFAFETQLVPQVMELGCLLVQLFLCMRHERFQVMHPEPQAGYKRMGPHLREVGTVFGKVRYWQTQ